MHEISVLPPLYDGGAPSLQYTWVQGQERSYFAHIIWDNFTNPVELDVCGGESFHADFYETSTGQIVYKTLGNSAGQHTENWYTLTSRGLTFLFGNAYVNYGEYANSFGFM